MAAPYSLDLRQSAVAAVKAGTPRLEVQRLFRLARSTLARWVRCERAGGSLEPKQGKPGFVGQFEDARTLARLHRQLKAHPDDRLLDHCRHWQKTTGKSTSPPTMWRAWQRLGWTHKKSNSPPASATRPSVPRGAKRTPVSGQSGSSS